MNTLKKKRKKRLNNAGLIENRGKVKKALERKRIDAAVCTNWPFIGPFLKFLGKAGVMKELGGIIGKWVRQMLEPQIYILLYILKIMAGIPTIRGSERLLGDVGAMKLIGFDAENLLNGLCYRGDANQHGKGYKKNRHVSWMRLH